MDKIKRELEKKGVNVDKLILWLQMPKQGVIPQVAYSVIASTARKFKSKENPHLDPSNYTEPYQKKLADKAFAEHFWVDRYVLGQCRKLQADMIKGKDLEIDPINLMGKLEELDKMIRPMRNFLTIPPYIRMIFGGFIGYSYRWIKSKWRRV